MTLDFRLYICDRISQDIRSQNFDIVQSDGGLFSQVQKNVGYHTCTFDIVFSCIFEKFISTFYYQFVS